MNFNQKMVSGKNEKKSAIRMTSLVIFLIFFSSLLVLSEAGKAARIHSESVSLAKDGVPGHMFNTSRDVYQFYRTSGWRGRILIHFGRFLHFEPIKTQTLNRLPLESYAALTSRYERELTERNYLWILTNQNIIREVYYVLPAKTYAEKAAAASAAKSEAFFKRGAIVVQSYGWKRIISDQLPSIDEPVLITVDASYMATEDYPELIEKLKKSGLETDALVFCLAEDNENVTVGERKKLIEAAEAWSRETKERQ